MHPRSELPGAPWPDAVVRRPMRHLLVAAAVALLIAACGGSSDGAAGDDPDVPTASDSDGSTPSAGDDAAANDGVVADDGASTAEPEGEDEDEAPPSIDLSVFDLDDDETAEDDLPVGPPVDEDETDEDEADDGVTDDEPVDNTPPPTPRQVPIDTPPDPLETVVIDDDDDPVGDEPGFAFDQEAALACANTEFGLDALIANDAASLDESLSTAADWADQTAASAIGSFADDLRTVRDPEAAEALVLAMLGACTDAGYEL